MEGYIADLNAEQAASPIVNLDALSAQTTAWGAAAAAVEARISTLLDAGGADTRELRRLGRALRRQERLLTAARGLPDRAWFKHQIYAPGRVTGYAAVFLPALDEAIEDGDAAIAVKYRDLIMRRLARATEVLDAAVP